MVREPNFYNEHAPNPLLPLKNSIQTILQTDPPIDPDISYPSLIQHAQAGNLSLFLQRIQQIKDYQNAPTRPHILQTVKNILDFAENNDEFRDILFDEALAGTTNCIDRPIYHLGKIGAQMACLQAASHTDHPEELLSAMINLEKIDIIEAYAANVISGGESLEAALYILLKLKEAGRIEVPISNMVHMSYAEHLVSKAQLTTIQEKMIEATSPDKYVDIVAASPYWKNRCSKLPEYLKISEQYTNEISLYLEHTEQEILEMSEEDQAKMQSIQPLTDAEKATKMDEISKQRNDALQQFIRQQAEIFVQSASSKTQPSA